MIDSPFSRHQFAIATPKHTNQHCIDNKEIIVSPFSRHQFAATLINGLNVK